MKLGVPGKQTWINVIIVLVVLTAITRYVPQANVVTDWLGLS